MIELLIKHEALWRKFWMISKIIATLHVSMDVQPMFLTAGRLLCTAWQQCRWNTCSLHHIHRPPDGVTGSSVRSTCRRLRDVGQWCHRGSFADSPHAQISENRTGLLLMIYSTLMSQQHLSVTLWFFDVMPWICIIREVSKQRKSALQYLIPVVANDDKKFNSSVSAFVHYYRN